jgi:hypothetical protein
VAAWVNHGVGSVLAVRFSTPFDSGSACLTISPDMSEQKLFDAAILLSGSSQVMYRHIEILTGFNKDALGKIKKPELVNFLKHVVNWLYQGLFVGWFLFYFISFFLCKNLPPPTQLSCAFRMILQ